MLRCGCSLSCSRRSEADPDRGCRAGRRLPAERGLAGLPARMYAMLRGCIRDQSAGCGAVTTRTAEAGSGGSGASGGDSSTRARGGFAVVEEFSRRSGDGHSWRLRKSASRHLKISAMMSLVRRLIRRADYASCTKSRPMTCRVFGPPVRSEGGLGVCELCFQGASSEEIAACEMIPDPDHLEDDLLAGLRRRPASTETQSLPSA